jgi:hypothetical protein
VGAGFHADSATLITSKRLPATVDFQPFADGAYQVLAPGGRLEINIYGTSESPWVLEAMIKFRDAGFEVDLVPSLVPGRPGPGSFVGTKPK